MIPLLDRSRCTALVITCSDFRFKTTEREFAASLGLTDDYDLIARPGSVRSLVQPRSPAAHDSMVEEVKLLASLHDVRRVVLVNHASCRAYDDITDEDHETAVHSDHLTRAIGAVQELLPDVEVDAHFITRRSGFEIARIA
jgi:carbonic anhydrase